MAWSVHGVWARLVTVSVAVSSTWSCVGADSDPSHFDWTCREGDETCLCDATKPGRKSPEPGEVDVCSDYGCCLLTERESEDAYASCECFEADGATCEAEATSRRDTKVIEHCPPGASPPACAALAESCRETYLDENALAGCCKGSICKLNGEGERVCETATEGEVALAERCDDVAHNLARPEFEVLTPSIRTSLGELRVDEVLNAYGAAGPGGCLNGLEITISSDAFSCAFGFT